MLDIKESMKLLTNDELKHIHQGSLKLLEETGMMIMVPDFLKALVIDIAVLKTLVLQKSTAPMHFAGCHNMRPRERHRIAF